MHFAVNLNLFYYTRHIPNALGFSFCLFPRETVLTNCRHKEN
jgi:hypothetical protein